ncbi:hypothetical protein PRZ48_008904 [Zasmidium cellare]|uniref:RING-type domain-containing protein n=1 Tax=Zasmidium cellare TaxID=395010 RepID=A0ABR0EH76_ZASCE|nr:hypothetical protein PRZ48_008904 [Zasmidium cellare]
MAAMLGLTPASLMHRPTSPACRIGRFLWYFSITRTISVVLGTFSIFLFVGLSDFNMEYRSEEERREARLAEVIEREQRDFARYYRELRIDAAWEKSNIIYGAICEIRDNPERGREIKDKALRDSQAVSTRQGPYIAHYRSLVKEENADLIHPQHEEVEEAIRVEQQGRCYVVVMKNLVFQHDEIVANGGDGAAPLEVTWTADDLERLRNVFPPPLTLTVGANEDIPPQDKLCYDQIEEDKCAVCWGPYVQHAYLKSCQHVFCFRCIVESLTESSLCPLCREERYWSDMDLLKVERIEEVKEDEEAEGEGGQME